MAPELEPGDTTDTNARLDCIAQGNGTRASRIQPASSGSAQSWGPVPRAPSSFPPRKKRAGGLCGSETALLLTHALPLLSFPGLKGARDDVGTRSRATTWVTLWKNSWTICDSRLEDASLIAPDRIF